MSSPCLRCVKSVSYDARMAKEETVPPRRESDDRAAKPAESVGGIVDEIASNRLFGDALTRIVDAGERVMHAQQSAMSALGLPSGSQFESLTLRVRTVFHRIEELEDDLDRLERRITSLETAARDGKPEPGRVTGSARVKPSVKPSVKPRPASAKPKRGAARGR